MTTEIDNININYIDTGGEKETVLLLHGWGSNISLFRFMIDALKDSFRVIALDMPGFGQSSEPDFAMDVSDYMEFVVKFVQSLKIKKLSLLGHSFGGRVIIKMMSRENLPFEVDKILLVDSAGIKPKKSKKTILKIKMFKLAKKLFNDTILGKMYPNFVENMRKRSGSADYNSSSPMMRSILVKVVNEDLTDLLSNIKNETLLIWGQDDDATPVSDARIMNEKIENSAIIIVEEAGHYSFLDKKDYVNSVITAFLKAGNN